MLSGLSKNVVRVFEELEYRVDEEGFVYRPNGSIVSVFIKYSGSGIPYYYFNVRFRESRDIKAVAVHKLVAYQKYGLRAFESGIMVRHLNGYSLDNSPGNIAIGTNRDNQLDIPEKDRIARSKHAASFRRRMSSEDTRIIRETRPKLSDICRRYGIDKSTASLIRSGKTYRD